MTTALATTSRRDRKKATTRRTIADAALRLFLERGYDATGIRDIAEEADVATTTLFAHFASKEALVFEQDGDFERQLCAAVTDRAEDEPLVPALRDATRALVLHMTSEDAAPVVRLIDTTPALQRYEAALRLRYADTLAASVTDALGEGRGWTPGRALARFTIDAYALARDADEPLAVLNTVFAMIEAAWSAARRGPEGEAGGDVAA